MNPHTKAAARAHADELCNLANQRFGYSILLRVALVEMGFNSAKIEDMMQMARDREIEKFLFALRGDK